MRKIFCLLILTAALIIGGCTKSSMTIESTDNNQVKISATNSSDGGGNAQINILDGASLHVDAKITAGKLIVDVANNKHTIDKTGEFFIDVPAGGYNLILTAQDGLTGEITLRALPKV